MALIRVPGPGIQYPYQLQPPTLPLAWATNALIDATGEKTAVSGQVWFSERTGTKTITAIGWRAGAIVSAGGSGIIVSLQNISAAAGPPKRPDETVDQSVNVLLSALVASGWNTSTLGSSRTVAFSEWLSIVWEFDGSGRLGSDSLIVEHLSSSRTRPMDVANVLLKTGGSWAVSSQNSIPNVVLVFSDGSFGTVSGAFPASNVGTLTLNTGTTPDEVAMQVSIPFGAAVDGCELYIERVSGADWSTILHSGTSVLQTHTAGVRNHATNSGETRNTATMQWDTETSLTAGSLYRVSVKPENGNNIVVPYFDVAAAGHLALFGGTDFHYWDRVDSGPWSNQNQTRALLLFLRISQIDVGGGTSTFKGFSW